MKGRITYSNQKFSALAGYSTEEIIGINYSDFDLQNGDNSFDPKMCRTICQGKTWKYIAKIKNKNNAVYWLDVTIIPFSKNKADKPISLVAIMTDITEKLKIEN